MRTVQMTLDEDLLIEVDEAVEKLGTTRSAFTRQALAQSLLGLKEKELEERQRAGYLRQPSKPGEFSDWHDEQVWPE